MADTGLFLTRNPFRHQLILVVSPSEASFRLIERTLSSLDEVELRWHSDTIEALADVFMSHPPLLVAFGDSNAETLEFIQLVRNNRQFREMPVFAVLPEPQRFGKSLARRLRVEKFGTPLDNALLVSKAREILQAQPQNPSHKS